MFRSLRRNLPNPARYLLTRRFDNLVFHRELRLDFFGRLGARSPVRRVHARMAWIELGLLVAWGAGGPMVFCALAFLIVWSACAASWSMAYRSAHAMLQRDRERGILEEIWLTRIPPREILEGKFEANLALFHEVHRHLKWIARAGLAVAWMALPLPTPAAFGFLVLSLSIPKALYATGVSAGTLAGLRQGARARDSLSGGFEEAATAGVGEGLMTVALDAFKILVVIVVGFIASGVLAPLVMDLVPEVGEAVLVTIAFSPFTLIPFRYADTRIRATTADRDRMAFHAHRLLTVEAMERPERPGRSGR